MLRPKLLARDVDHVDRIDGHLEQRLDGSLDFSLGGVLHHPEDVLVLLFANQRAFLGDDRSDHHLCQTIRIHPSIS